MVLNTLTAWPQRGRVLFVSVDFNPADERQRCLSLLTARCGLSLDHDLLQHFLADVDDGQWQGWHSCVAKNTAHMAALSLDSGDDVVLVNLDGDNLITEEFLCYILDHADQMTKWKGEVGGVSSAAGGVPSASLRSSLP